MIRSADEFVALRTSHDPTEYRRAAHECADDVIWLEVIVRYPEMREWVARNKTTSAEILRILSRDPDVDVRWAVANVRRLPQDVFDSLSRDTDSSVRTSVALNRKAPASVLDRLSTDPHEDVAKAAQERLLERGLGSQK